MSRRRLGVGLTFAGNLLVIAAFFVPWFDVYKLNDPSFPFPRRGYSPWMILLGGQRDSLSIATWAFLLLIACMAARCLAAAFSRSASGRARAIIGAFGLALLSLVMMGLAVAMIPFDLSFFWPFLNSTMAYGVYLAAAGFAATLLGLTLLSANARQPARQPA
jgi:hypothetical protein